jgi:hypothetical protein
LIKIKSMKKILLIISVIFLMSCGNSKEEAEREMLKARIKSREQELDSLEKEGEMQKEKGNFKLELMKAGKTEKEADKIVDSLYKTDAFQRKNFTK